MRRWMRAIIALFCLAATIAPAGRGEPYYEGQSLSAWASQIDPEQILTDQPATKAIRHIGADAIPTLLDWISVEDPPRPTAHRFSSAIPGDRAVMVFLILGDKARPAIPALTRYAMKFPDPQRCDRCISSLAYIGPKSMRSFVKILTEGRPEARFSALGCLAVFHTNAVPALAAAISCLTGNDEQLGWKAADELSRLDVPPSILVPALKQALHSASAPARRRILKCLQWMGNTAGSHSTSDTRSPNQD
jgi:hypothetical protein